MRIFYQSSADGVGDHEAFGRHLGDALFFSSVPDFSLGRAKLMNALGDLLAQWVGDGVELVHRVPDPPARARALLGALLVLSVHAGRAGLFVAERPAWNPPEIIPDRRSLSIKIIRIPVNAIVRLDIRNSTNYISRSQKSGRWVLECKRASEESGKGECSFDKSITAFQIPRCFCVGTRN